MSDDPNPPEPKPTSLRGRIIGLTYLLGVLGAAVAVTSVDSASLPTDLTTISVTFVLSCLSLFAAGRQWLSLVSPAPATRSAVLGALYRSQIAKYLPVGGFVQAAIQIAGDGADRAEAKRRARAFPLSVLLILLAGCVVGSMLAFESTTPGWVRLVSTVLPLGLLVLTPAVFGRLAGLASRLIPRLAGGLSLPEPARLGRSLGWSLLNMLAVCSAFYFVVHDHIEVGYFGVVGAFALAWVGGFLVVPLPGGLGVREALLVLALPSVELSDLLTASVGHRFITIAAEFAVLAGHQAISALARLRSEPPDADILQQADADS